MVRTLKEIAFSSLSNEERKMIPCIMENDVKQESAQRIQRWWKRQDVSKILHGTMRIEENKVITKRLATNILVYHFKSRTVFQLVDFLHSYFHQHNQNATISDEEIDKILYMFKHDVNNNSHAFFSNISQFIKNSRSISILKPYLYHVFDTFSKDILIDMISKYFAIKLE